MRWVAAIVAAALLAIGVTAAGGEAAPRTGGVETARCAGQSFAGFPNAYGDPDNLVVGPLAFVHGLSARDSTPEGIRRIGGFKSPAVVRPGHVVRVSIDRASRSNARLLYTHSGGSRTEEDFAELPHTVVFRACPRRRAGSRVNGRRATFWSGFFVVREAPACIGLNVSVDGRRARHRVIPVARPDCP